MEQSSLQIMHAGRQTSIATSGSHLSPALLQPAPTAL